MEQKFSNNSIDLQTLREFCEREGETVIYHKGDQLEREGDLAQAASESLGIERMGKAYTTALYKELEVMMDVEHLQNTFYELAFLRLIAKGSTFSVLDVTDLFSCELDTVEDFENAKQRIPAHLI